MQHPRATSTIVMGLLTCVPFGLAIRDTATGNNGTSARGAAYDDDDDDDGDDDDDDGDAGFEARMRALEQAEAEQARLEEAARAQHLVTLYGAEPASLGPAFAGIQLGVNEAELDGAALAGIHRIERTAGLQIELGATAGAVSRIVIVPARTASNEDAEALCDELGQRLRIGWGEGRRSSEGHRVWANPLSRQRAVLRAEPSCRYVVERYAPVATWLGTSRDAVIPMWAIGQPAQRLIDVLGDRAEIDGDSISWLGLGLEAGTGDTVLNAHLERGKVVTIEAGTDGEPSLVEEHLTATFGAPDEENDEVVRWRSKPPISLKVSGGWAVRPSRATRHHVLVTVGKHE